MAPKVLMVAGEASADSHAAHLVDFLKQEFPGAEIYGVGGEALAAQGMDIVVRSETLNAVGLTDWLDRVGEVLGGFKKIVGLIRSRRPDFAVLLDLPDFNLRLAKRLKAAGIPVYYYISPQVWAWRRYRIRKIRRYVDKMLVVFPFEETFYRKHGVEVTFVGHPLMESIEPRSAYREAGAVRAAPRLGLLPGSRLSELSHHGALLDEVVHRLRRRYPRAEFRVPLASTVSEAQMRTHIRSPYVELVGGGARSVYEWADCALIASGTATLEAALVGVPFALFYRVSRFTAFAFRFFIRYRGFLGMPNVLLGREAIREFFQDDATADKLYEECVRLVESEKDREQCLASLRACRSLLGGPGASRRVASELRAAWNTLGGGGLLEPLPS
jgi:lipid-A-disaccharide synthase